MASEFEDLLIWQKAHLITIEIYKFTRKFPSEEKFSLTDQLRRSAGSVGANIAESFGRKTSPDAKKFLFQAKGSLLETINHIYLATDLGYLDRKDKLKLVQELKGLNKGLITYISRFN